MALFEGKTQSERYKLIAALILPLIALFFVYNTFFASGTKPAAPTNRNANSNSKRAAAPQAPVGVATADGAGGDAIDMPREIDYHPISYSAPDPARNIFAFYVKPTPVPGAVTTPVPPTPTPTPPPPLMLGSLQPANVFARTGDFALVVAGDKFTPQSRIYVDSQELATKFVSAQQLTANVPAALVQAPGARAVMVRTPDGALYSNTQTVNVMPPPVPQFTFIGVIGTKHYSDDKAILKANAGNDLITVKRGDIVGGRFKVTSISDRVVEFTDTQLNIKHSIPYTDAKGVTGGIAPRAPQPATADDDDGEP